jgi:sec-independent protein translocase protein TatB
MFDLDVSKMIIVGIVALAVIPPKDLPRVMRTVGQTVGKMRRMAAEFQGQFMDAMREVEREADLESVKKEFQAINDQARVDAAFDPVDMVRDDVTKAVQSPTESGKSEIGKSEIALTGPEPAENPPAALATETESQPEAPARRSAAE